MKQKKLTETRKETKGKGKGRKGKGTRSEGNEANKRIEQTKCLACL